MILSYNTENHTVHTVQKLSDSVYRISKSSAALKRMLGGTGFAVGSSSPVLLPSSIRLCTSNAGQSATKLPIPISYPHNNGSCCR